MLTNNNNNSIIFIVMENLISEQCFNQYAGSVNPVLSISLLLQTILQNCQVPSQEKWPLDYGPIALQNGKYLFSISNYL